MKENIIQIKTYDFALKIIRLYKLIVDEKNEYVLSKQLLRCGTSIGANVEEAIGGQSERDFLAKLSISYKEARETKYWINLLYDSSYINQKDYEDLKNDIEEILRIIGSIQKTIKNRNS